MAPGGVCEAWNGSKACNLHGPRRRWGNARTRAAWGRRAKRYAAGAARAEAGTARPLDADGLPALFVDYVADGMPVARGLPIKGRTSGASRVRTRRDRDAERIRRR